MNYTLKITDQYSLEGAERAEIAENPWNTPYSPETYFRGVFVKERGFLFSLVCKEKNPRITMFRDGEDIWNDSCMELFLNCDPEAGDEYLNFEINAAGASLIGIGVDGSDERRHFSTRVKPGIKTMVRDEEWEIELFIPVETICEYYGKELSFSEGSVLKGNAFKCGDETEIPHFLAWSRIHTPEPNFHVPNCFGTFTLAK